MTSARIIKRETLSDGWAKLYRATVEATRFDGKTVQYQREILDRGQAARVLPYDPERRTVLMIRQMRAPVLFNGDNPVLLEAPAGMIDEGEEAIDAARRECEEEAGLGLRAIDHVTSVYTTPGSQTEVIHLFTAPYEPSMKVGDGGGLASEHEDIEVVEMPFDEVFDQIPLGRMDSTTVILVQHLALTVFRESGA